MKAVNLIPKDQRRDRSAVSVGSFGPAHVVILVLVVVVALILLRVLADNTVNNRKATLSAVQTQVAAEQAEASKLSVYTDFVRAAEQREADIREIADSRFAWKRTFDQIGHVMPATTSLKSLTALTAPAAGTSSSSTVATGPTINLIGCANTRNQNGVATLMRRLRQLSGSTTIEFTSSTRLDACGNSFNVTVAFRPLPGQTSTTSAAPATTTTTSTATTTTTGTTG